MKKISYVLLGLIFISCSLDKDFSLSSMVAYEYQYSNQCDYVVNDQSCLIKKIETFEFPSKYPVDLLFIVDRSPEMPLHHLYNVASGFSDLISKMDDDFDWRVTVVSANHPLYLYPYQQTLGDKSPFSVSNQPLTTISDINLLDVPQSINFSDLQYEVQRENKSHILSNQIKNYKQVLYDTIRDRWWTRFFLLCNGRSFCDVNLESSLKTLQVLMRQSYKQNFFRKNADLLVFVITYQDEKNNNDHPMITSELIQNDFDRFFSKSGSLKKLTVNAVSINTSKCFNYYQKNMIPNSAYPLRHLSRLVSDTNGMMLSLCDSDLQSFTQLLDHLKKKIHSTVPLAYKPVINMKKDMNIKVTASDRNHQIISKPYSFIYRSDDNALQFEKTLQPESFLEVQYYYNAGKIK